MNVRELAVPGAWEVTPVVHTDTRGAFFEWFTDPGFTAFAGHRFDLRHTVNPLDPALDIAWPLADSDLTLSERDRAAPTFAQALADGLLPTWSPLPRP